MEGRAANIAETVRDVYSSLLEEPLRGQAIQQPDGKFTFPTYVQQGEYLVPGQGCMRFAYAAAGLHVEVLFGETAHYSGFLPLDDDAIVALLSSHSFSLVQNNIWNDTAATTTIPLFQVNGIPVQHTPPETAPETYNTGLPYFGTNLPEHIVKRIRQRFWESPEPSTAQPITPHNTIPTLDERLGYCVIDPEHDDARQRTAALLANWERQGIYKEERWIFAEGKDYGLQDIIPDHDAANIIGTRQHMLRQRREEARAAIPAVERVRMDCHPLVLVYLLNTPKGRGPFVRDEAVQESLYLDDAGLEYMRTNLLERKGAGILRASVHELQLGWYKDAWNILTEQRGDAAGRVAEASPQQNYNHYFLAGKTFRSVAQRQADGSYVLPVVVAGETLPLGIEAHLIIGDEIRVFSAVGVIGKRFKERLAVPHTNRIIVTYQSSPDTPGITIEEITRRGDVVQAAVPEDVAECGSAGAESGGSETSPHTEIRPRQEMPGSRSLDVLLRGDGGLLQGASRIRTVLGLDGGQFSQRRDALRRAGLLYQDEPGGPWYMRQSDVPAARELLGIERVVIHLPDKPAELPVSLPGTGKDDTEKRPARHVSTHDQKTYTEYDPLRHVPLHTLVREIAAFSRTDRDIGRYIFGRSMGDFPKIKRQHGPGDRILNFLDREDVGDLVRMFQPTPDLDLRDETVAAIEEFYAARAILNSDVPQGMLRLDFAIKERGLDIGSKPFFSVRHYLARVLGERIFLVDGMYPAVAYEDRNLVETLLDAYFKIDRPSADASPVSTLTTSTTSNVPPQTNHPPRDKVITSLEGRVSDVPTQDSPRRAGTGTNNHIYLCWAEGLVPRHIGPGAGKGRFFRAMKTQYGADEIPAGGALFEHVIELSRLYQKHGGQYLSLDDAVRTIQAELDIEDIAAMEIVENEQSFKDARGRIRKELVLGYALRHRFIWEHPEFAGNS